MQSGSQEWWDHNVNGFSERDFIQNFRRMFVFVCDSSLLTVMMSDGNVTLNSDMDCMPVQTEVTGFKKSDPSLIETCI